jgi:pimeloyl-ACP methyl ester carboxylesterase
MVHGGGTDRRAWLRHVPFLHAAGHACLLFDGAGHGASGGGANGIRYGHGERVGVRVAARWMRARDGIVRVAVLGTSVGATAAIMALPGADGIAGIVAENPILSGAAVQAMHVDRTLTGVLGDGALARGAIAVLQHSAYLWLQFRITGTFAGDPRREPRTVVAGSDVPLLILHGTADDTVPLAHSEELHALARRSTLHAVPGAAHCGVFDTAPDLFKAEVLAFLKGLK